MKYIYNVVDNNMGGNIHPMTTFFSLLNIIDENDFLTNKLKMILVSSSYFPL
jgi:hypothetical protein